MSKGGVRVSIGGICELGFAFCDSVSRHVTHGNCRLPIAGQVSHVLPDASTLLLVEMINDCLQHFLLQVGGDRYGGTVLQKDIAPVPFNKFVDVIQVDNV